MFALSGVNKLKVSTDCLFVRRLRRMQEQVGVALSRGTAAVAVGGLQNLHFSPLVFAFSGSDGRRAG